MAARATLASRDGAGVLGQAARRAGTRPRSLRLAGSLTGRAFPPHREPVPQPRPPGMPTRAGQRRQWGAPGTEQKSEGGREAAGKGSGRALLRSLWPSAQAGI